VRCMETTGQAPCAHIPQRRMWGVADAGLSLRWVGRDPIRGAMHGSDGAGPCHSRLQARGPRARASHRRATHNAPAAATLHRRANALLPHAQGGGGAAGPSAGRGQGTARRSCTWTSMSSSGQGRRPAPAAAPPRAPAPPHHKPERVDPAAAAGRRARQGAPRRQPGPPAPQLWSGLEHGSAAEPGPSRTGQGRGRSWCRSGRARGR